jgi:hypothetical protein
MRGRYALLQVLQVIMEVFPPKAILHLPGR